MRFINRILESQFGLSYLGGLRLYSLWFSPFIWRGPYMTISRLHSQVTLDIRFGPFKLHVTKFFKPS